MTKRKFLTFSTAISVLMILLCGIITLKAALSGSEDSSLAEGLSRALIIIFGIVALIYLGISLIVKLIGIALQNNIFTVLVMLIDILSVAIVSGVIISAVLEPDFTFTSEFLIEALPFVLLILSNAAAAVFDILSFKSPKKANTEQPSNQ